MATGYIWQRLLYYPINKVCIELGQKLAKEQLEADAREKLLMQILPAGVIKKLLSNDYQNNDTNNLDKGKGGGDRKQEKSTQKSKEKNLFFYTNI